jgi:N-acetylneuraminic acid mutarotase
VFGGFERPGKEIAWQPVNNAWEYSPSTETWKAIAPLPTKRGGGSAIVSNGKIYVIGGATILPGASDPAIRFDGKPHDMCVGVNEEYDPATNTWKTRAAMPTARNHFVAGEVNGKIYAIGGRLGSTFVTRSSNTDVTEEYDCTGPVDNKSADANCT